MSKNQPLQISILKQVPTSTELVQTLKSLQKITPISIQSSQFKKQIKNISEQNLVLYKSHNTPEGQPNYVCFVQQQRNQDFYINQLTGQVFRVQPLEGLVLQKKQSQLAKLSQQNLSKMKILYKKLNQYLDMYYTKQYGATCHFNVLNDSIQEIFIGITNKFTNTANYSNGQWTSKWIIKTTQFYCKINARNHFYQGGNILFQRPKQFVKTLSNQQNIKIQGLNEVQINKIINMIRKQEKMYQKELEAIYTRKLPQSLKKLRRISPVTQNKMIWNINAVLLSEGLSQLNINTQ